MDISFVLKIAGIGMVVAAYTAYHCEYIQGNVYIYAFEVVATAAAEGNLASRLIAFRLFAY